MTTITTFPSEIAELIASAPLQPLLPGTPNKNAFAQLSQLRIDTAFIPHAVHDRDMAACCLAGLWLLHGFLDDSHKISQDIDTANGSYWHGIMHRREPDYGNSKYWFRRVGRHPIFEPLRAAAAEIAASAPPAVPIPSPWDPFWFIDYCEQSAAGPEAAALLARQIQQKEWELLFDYCYRDAVGDA